MSEDGLIERVLRGDAAAERALYEAHVDRVYRLAYRMAGDDDLAQDFTQETFIRAFDRLADFRGDAAFSTWLHRIATTVALNGLRRVGRHRKRETELGAASVVADAGPKGVEPDLRDRLHEAIDGLPEIYRTVFVMHDVEGYTHEEIGGVLGVSDRNDQGAPLAGAGQASRGAGGLCNGVGAMTDERFEEFLRDAARGYNAPPQAPKDAMWARIEEARRFRRPRRTGWRQWSAWGVGAAAVLAVGFGIGRVSIGPVERAAPAVATAGATADAPASTPYRVATIQHLSQAEVLLTSFRARGAADTEPVGEWARDLLSTTRLLLDSPAARDPETARLLEYLELVLAQIAQLPSAGRDEEKELIDEAMEQGNVIPRLRALVPAGTQRMTL